MKHFKLVFLIGMLVGKNGLFAQESDFVPTGLRVDSVKNTYRCQFYHNSFNNLTDFNNGRFTNTHLFRDIDITPFELVSANVKFQDKDDIQKVVFAPMRLSGLANCLRPGSLLDWITDFKMNVTQTTSNTVIGGGFGFDNSSPRSKRSRRLTAEVFNSFPAPASGKTGEKWEDYKKRVLESYEKKLDSLALLVYEARARSVLTLNFGYNNKFFSILEAKSDIPTFDSTNYYGTQSNVWSASFSYGCNIGSVVVGAGYNVSQMRQSAARGQEKIPYHGFNFSINKRIFRFITDNSKLRKTEAYKGSLFIPGLHFGLIYDQSKTNSNKYEFVKDKRISRVVITPTVDILITPTAQFQFSFPITKDKTFEDVKTRIMGGSISYVLKLSNLGK